MLRVLIADDHALVRKGLRQALLEAGGIDVTGEAADGATTLNLVRTVDADLLILDVSMPGRNGIELIKQIKDHQPALKVMVLTVHAEQQYATRAFKAGAVGYLTKDTAAEELIVAVRKVASGGIYVSRSLAELLALQLTQSTLALPHQSLSDREYDVLRRITNGETITQIAQALFVSVKTASTYRSRVLEKMQLPHDAALIRYALENRLFERATGDGG